MGTLSLRLRLVFEDRLILSKTQRSDGMARSWLLLKLQQHRTISDVCAHLLHIFNLHRSCPNGILLTMEGFALPPFESTEILKDMEIICVKKKGGSTPDACNLLDDELAQGDDGPLLLENDNQSESEEVDEEQSQDEELPEETLSKKRKASRNIQNLKKKKRCLVSQGDDEDENELEEIEDIKNDASHPMKISSKKKINKIAATSNKKIKSTSTVKRSEELQEDVEEPNQVSNAPTAKKICRSSKRKKAQRKRKRELASNSIPQKKQTGYSKREITKPKNKEADGQPKGLLYWKQASKMPVQNADVSPIVTRPGHVRFESPDEADDAAEQTGRSTEKIHCNGSSSKKKGQKWSREKLSTFRRNDHYKRINKEAFKMLFKDSKVPVIDPDDFDKLPPCSEPKEGDVIAYRLLELNSSWIPELSSFRVGRISYYDAKDIVLIPVTEYPIVSQKSNADGLKDSPYGKDGTLEINYSALVDVRNVKQYNPDATEPLSDGVNQTPISDGNGAAAEKLVSYTNDNMDVPKDSNPGEAGPWDRFSSKNIEIPEPSNPGKVDYGVNPSSYGGAGPSTSTNRDANKAASSEVKEGREGDPINPWLNANPGATEPLSDGVNQTPISDGNGAAAEKLVSYTNDNMDVPKDSNPGEASPWDRFSSKNIEIPEPGNPSKVDHGVNPSSYGGAGPSTSTNRDANKAASSEVKEGREGDPTDPWLNAKKADPSQENISGWLNVKTGPAANDCETGSSWGRPWSSFVVSKSNSIVQQKEDNRWPGVTWHGGRARGTWKATPHGAPRGRGRGRGDSRGRGRGRGRNGN